MKYLVFLFCLASLPAFSCTETFRGKDIDQLIEVENVENSTYRITVPRKIRHLDFGVSMTLHYYKPDDELKISQHREVLSPQLQGDFYTLETQIVAKAKWVPYVLVLWKPEACCECPAIGQSQDISL